MLFLSFLCFLLAIYLGIPPFIWGLIIIGIVGLIVSPYADKP